MFAGNFAPAGWMFCEGQLLPISENETLFQLIGTTYGGDGEATFALPDLRGRVPIHQGNGSSSAETGGAEEVTLTVNQIPAHSHAAAGEQRRRRTGPRRAESWPESPHVDALPRDTATAALAPASIAPTGGSSRTRTSSPTSASTSSSRCSASSPLHRPRTAMAPVRRRDPDLPVQLRAQRLGLVQRAAAAASRRTPRCSRCSARPTAATASRTFALPDLRVGRRCTPARVRD